MSDDFLPVGWAVVPLKDVATKIVDGSHNPPAKRETGLPMLSGRNIENGSITFDGFRLITEADFASEDARTRISVGDVLLTIVGTIGRSAVVRSDHRRFTLQRSVAVVSSNGIDPKFLSLQFQAPVAQRFFSEHAKGTAQKGIYLKTLGVMPIHLPPLAEQKRIVAKVEELFSELEAGEESLRAARRQLSVYRQSLLKQAFEGKLTAHWRTQNSAKLESSDQLLARIREAKDSLGIRESQISLDVLDRASDSLPSIPADWHWLRLENLASIGTGMSVSQARLYDDPIEVPYLRVANVQRGRLDLAEMRTMLVEKSRLADLRLKPRDILFNEGGDRDKLGRGWVWSGQIDPCITQNHVFRATVFSSSIVLPEFVSHWGNAFGQEFFHLTGKQTTNLASISKAALSSLPVPVPPVEEQKEILRLLDEQFEVIERNEREIDAALKRSEVLRQAILKKAFTGRLVPQDPADEPASALLARLRADMEFSVRSARKSSIANSRKS